MPAEAMTKPFTRAECRSIKAKLTRINRRLERDDLTDSEKLRLLVRIRAIDIRLDEAFRELGFSSKAGNAR